MKNAYISCRAYPELKSWLINQGYNLTELPEHNRPYPAISSHPDIYMCSCGGRIMKAANGEIKDTYPDYLGYNGIFLNNYFVHNLKCSSGILLREAERMGLKLINVKQGYTKCSCIVVDGNSVITADAGIAAKLKICSDIDVLEIRQGFVRLDGFEYGFIGGATGKAGNCVLFNGDLKAHPDSAVIRAFIESRGLEIVDFRNHVLYDIGTIFAE